MTLIRKRLKTKEKRSTLYYYKSPNTLTNQGTYNWPQLWHFRVVKSSNLTFRGYLAGTTPVLSVRSSLFLLHRCCLSMWGPCDLLLIFQHHQLAPAVGSDLVTYKPNYRFQDKKLHGTYSLVGDHQQHLGRQVTTHCPGKASPNPHNSNGTSHQIELRPRRIVMAKEHRDGYPRGRPRRYQCWEKRPRGIGR